MRSFVRLKNKQPRKLPAQFREQDVRYPAALVETFLQRYSQPGDTVFDPFAGFGTTLLTAEAMGRRAWGLEIEASRVAYVRGQMRDPEHLLHGDARQLGAYRLPMFDCVLTSPPFIEQGDSLDPLTNYRTPAAGYGEYLASMQAIFAQLRERLKPGAHVVLEVANLKGPAGVTTLAWDVARAVSHELEFVGEVVIGWDQYAYGYDHSYALVFRTP